MGNTNQRKQQLLGVPFGTANGKLKKLLLFDAVGKLGLRICYRCGSEIENVNDFSVEHKTSWMYAEDPVKAFYALDNIAYSHLVCNVSHGARPNKRQDGPLTNTEKSQKRRSDPVQRLKEHEGRKLRRARGHKH